MGIRAPLNMAKAIGSALTKSLSRVVGHHVVKEGIILGLIAKEHVYIEGPPGVAKTMLAETMAAATSLQFFFYQMHRDTRLAELIGEAVVMRSTDPETGGEIIRQHNRPGGVLTSDLCVLDDISRAPGESLNVLLRILNERKIGDTPIPLRSAIATSNPAGELYFNEPLDRALLDRFTVQMRIDGLLESGSWSFVEQLLAKECSNQSISAEQSAVVLAQELDEAYTALGQVIVPQSVQALLLKFLQQLQQACANVAGSGEDSALLTDRTFVVKSIKMLKAKAVLDGRSECIAEDLQVLQYLTTFRVPESVHFGVAEMLADLAKDAGEPDDDDTDQGDSPEGAQGGAKKGDQGASEPVP